MITSITVTFVVVLMATSWAVRKLSRMATPIETEEEGFTEY